MSSRCEHNNPRYSCAACAVKPWKEEVERLTAAVSDYKELLDGERLVTSKLTAEVADAFIAGFEAGYEADGLYRPSGSPNISPIHCGTEAYHKWRRDSGSLGAKDG